MTKRWTAFLLFAAGHCASPALAQSKGAVVPPAAAIQSVPVTHVLAIGTLKVDPRNAQFRAAMPTEVARTVELYLQGGIEQWYVQKDANGVVFVLNAVSTDEARAKLARLPLVANGSMTFDLIALGPLAPLGMLIPHE